MFTTQQIADRYYDLSKTGAYDQIQDELYGNNCVSIEPDSCAEFGPTRVEGIAAIKGKAKVFHDMIEEMYSGYCNAPIVAGNYFACTMGMDVKYKGQERMKMDEVCVFGCKDGKIISEQFFF